MNKKLLRQKIREQKKQLSDDYIVKTSRRLAEMFLETRYYKDAKTVYGYLSYNQEVRTVPILEQALRDGKRVAVPKVYGDTMRFIYLDDLSAVENSSMNIPEPVADEPVAEDETALVLMPGVAFDRKGNRMGYGGGFYDKFLNNEPNHPTVALCYEFQMVEELPTDDYDIPVDCVLWA